MFFSLTPYFFSPHPTFIRIQWPKHRASAQGMEGGTPESREKFSQRVRGPPSPAPVSSTLKPCKGLRPLDFLCVWLKWSSLTNRAQVRRGSFLLSDPQTGSNTPSVINPEWLLWPWWIFKPFLFESTGTFSSPFNNIYLSWILRDFWNTGC